MTALAALFPLFMFIFLFDLKFRMYRREWFCAPFIVLWIYSTIIAIAMTAVLQNLGRGGGNKALEETKSTLATNLKSEFWLTNAME